MNRNTRFVIDWCERMRKRYGHPVVRQGSIRSSIRDWGQALARARFGDNWVEETRKEENFDPDRHAVEIAKRLEDGDWPDWLNVTRKACNRRERRVVNE